MGRSRGNFNHADDDPTQRSRRKMNAAIGENSEFGAAGQGAGEGKRALYHCNYCNKDITGKIRIKCAVCPDFDLCIECFSVGAKVTPHKSNHPYRVMDNLSFPIFCPDWNADDEILLLEGMEMYGMANWAEVAEHVGTKSKEACIEHYKNVYLNSPLFPLSDMSHVVGKNRNELLAMAKGQGDDMKGLPIKDLSRKDESGFSPSGVIIEDSNKTGYTSHFASNLNSESDSGNPVNTHAAASANLEASNKGRGEGGPGIVKMEDFPVDGDFGGKKPNSSENDGPSLLELSGYNPKRHEFDIEYDNEAENLLVDMEFKDTDLPEEREMKILILHIYGKRRDERKRRKDFIIERGLLYPNPLEKDFPPEEKALCRSYDMFMRHHSKEAHDELLRTVISEHRFKKQFEELKEAWDAGCRNRADADIYVANKRREAEESVRRAREDSQVGPNNHDVPNPLMSPDSMGARPDGPTNSSSVNEMDISGYFGAELLAEAEKRMCCELRMPPVVYLKMQEVLSMEMICGTVTSKSDAHKLFEMDPAKVDRVYDMLIRKGLGSP